MRVWARETLENGTKQWVSITTDANGYNDAVYLTALAQCLLLCLGESPFWANLGIPAQPSVIQQVFPDFYIAFIQQYFSQFFASLIVAKENSPTPTYNIAVTTNQGAVWPLVGIPAGAQFE